MKRYFLPLVLLLFTANLVAQDWVNLMLDPEVNFYEVKDSFEEHWEGKSYERGKGWKQYKRWEYFVEPRVYPHGNRQNSSTYFESWQNRPKPEANAAKSNTPWVPLGPTSWTSQGWNPGLGRINGIVVDPSDASILYVATPSGGLWKSVNGGEDWFCLTDHLPAIGASGLAVDHNDSNILYLATGDGNGGDAYSIGVMKSTDGGISWETTGLVHQVSQQIRCSRILINPEDSQTLWVATGEGLYVTNNGGASWSQSIDDNIRDVEINPANPNIIYASGRRFYRSTDGGLSFNQISSGVPSFGQVNRLAIAVTEANADYVYMVAGDQEDSGFQGLYRSTDGGLNFELRSDSPNILTYSEIGDGEGGQSWYDLAIAASPTNENLIFVGGINVWSSNNGGIDWTIRSHWVHPSNIGYTHADIHTLDFYGNNLYCGSDGGIFLSQNNGGSWSDLSEGLQISQFYRIAVSATDPNKVLTASQDNGTNLFFEGEQYLHLLGGDGNAAAIDYSNDNIMYSAYPGGSFQRSSNGGVSFSDFTSGVDESGAWVTPLEFHPTNPNILFAAYENVWKNTNNGTWTPISNLPISGTLRALKVAPSDADVIYTSSFGSIFKTVDGGANWNSVSNNLPDLFITYIEIHPDDADRIWITMSGYNAGNKVFYSENGGSSWQNISQNLPNIPANCIAYQTGSNDGLYVGTDAGLYYKNAENLNWVPYNDGLPNVIINQIFMHYPSSKIYLGTYGRGVWTNDFLEPSVFQPISAFSAEDNLICAGDSIQFTNQSLFATDDFTWTFEGGTPQTSSEVNPRITYNDGGTFSVKLVAANENGQDSLEFENFVEVLDAIGQAAPIIEDFEAANSFDDIPWYTTNDDGLIEWELNTEIGYQSERSLWLNNFDNLPLNEDHVLSKTFDLSGLDTAIVTLRVAYAPKSGSGLERLRVSVSTDCGENWQFKKLFTSSNDLPSAEPIDLPFIPMSEMDWNLLVIDNISPEERTDDFRIQFTFRSGGGNNVYIDDINIVNALPVSVQDRNPVAEGLKLYPNPSGGGMTSLEFYSNNQNELSIEIYDALGRKQALTWRGIPQIGLNRIPLETEQMASGIYILKLIGSNRNFSTATLVIE